MTSNYQVAQRWAERIEDPSLKQRNAKKNNVFCDEDVIYSYGRHFPMATVIRKPNGKPRLVLVNGDSYSSTTTQHQSTVRQALRDHVESVPIIIIPETALGAAGIVIDSIRPLDVKEDGISYTLQIEDEPPKGAVEVDGWAADWKGERKYAGNTKVLATRQHGGHEIRVIDGKYHWHTARHWLGDCVFMARRHGERAATRWISSFDRQEPGALYFLCRLPRCKASTLEEALESLKPDAVKIAESMGREPVRQGDIFAIPLPGLATRQLTSSGGVRVRRHDVTAPGRVARKMDLLLISIVNGDRLDWQGRTEQSWGRPGVFRPSRLSWDESRTRVREVHQQRRDRWTPILQARINAAEDAATPVEEIALLGTTHTATEVLTMPDGTQYARGMMYHDPALMGEGRTPDHIRQKLGKTWHLIVKNTVPTQKDSGRRSSALA